MPSVFIVGSAKEHLLIASSKAYEGDYMTPHLYCHKYNHYSSAGGGRVSGVKIIIAVR